MVDWPIVLSFPVLIRLVNPRNFLRKVSPLGHNFYLFIFYFKSGNFKVGKLEKNYCSVLILPGFLISFKTFEAGI